MHSWKNRPISHPDHHADLEHEAASHEFGANRLGRHEAEEAAYQSYKRKQHAEAISHHIAGMRSAISNGDRKDAEKHNAMYSLHMQALGLKPNATPPPQTTSQAEFKPSMGFSSHPADQLLVKPQ